MFLTFISLITTMLMAFASLNTKSASETCWNYVVAYDGHHQWPNDCKGDSKPFEELICGSKIGGSLSKEEVVAYKEWVAKGSPKTICQTYVPKKLCFEQVSKLHWRNGCAGNPDPRASRCTANLVPLSKVEVRKYKKWIQAGMPTTPCQNRIPGQTTMRSGS